MKWTRNYVFCYRVKGSLEAVCHVITKGNGVVSVGKIDIYAEQGGGDGSSISFTTSFFPIHPRPFEDR